MSIAARRPPSRLALSLRLLAVVGWIVLWSGVAWAAWQNAVADSDLTARGRAVDGVVLGATPAAQIKLGQCRQDLTVVAPAGGSFTVPAVRWCAQPWTTGEALRVVVDPRNPARGVPAREVQDQLSIHLAPISAAALAAVVAGFPLGRLTAAMRRRRDDEWS